MITISTTKGLKEKKKEIVEYFKKIVGQNTSAAPFIVTSVKEGSIIVGTLLPVYIIKDAEEFREAIRNFLNQMVTRCKIDTSIPLVVKVKITVSDFKQQG